MDSPVDVSFMDILFDRDDPVLKLMDDRDMFKGDFDTKTDLIGTEKLENWTNEDELLSDILNTEFNVFDSSDLMDVADIKCETTGSDCYSDSGYSNGQTSPGLPNDYDFSPCRVDDDDQMSSTISTTSDSSLQNAADDEANTKVVATPEPPRKKVRQVMKVSPMLASNPRSVLLPVNTANGVRTFKIVTPVGGIKSIKSSATTTAAAPVVLKTVRSPSIPVAVRNVRNLSSKKTKSRNLKSMGISGADSDDEITVVSDSDDEKNRPLYPRLVLSTEERKLMQKEGVVLPTHYPLTKFEERELKRIRRKIRNKISAQDSRKRKKEYLDGLEDRVRQCTQENQSLVKKIKFLQSQNQSLVTQLKKLQAALAGKGAKTAQPATCLLVLILSVALVMAPNLRLTNNTDVDVTDQEANVPEQSLSPMAGRTRTLLSSGVVPDEECIINVDGDDVATELHDLLRFHGSPMSSICSGVPGSRKSSGSWSDTPDFLADHDYDPPPSKRARQLDRYDDAKDFIVPRVDDVWPPPKIQDVLKPKQFIIPDVDDEWLPKSSGLMEAVRGGETTEIKVNVTDGTGTRTVLIQVPKEKK